MPVGRAVKANRPRIYVQAPDCIEEIKAGYPPGAENSGVQKGERGLCKYATRRKILPGVGRQRPKEKKTRRHHEPQTGRNRCRGDCDPREISGYRITTRVGARGGGISPEERFPKSTYTIQNESSVEKHG